MSFSGSENSKYSISIALSGNMMIGLPCSSLVVFVRRNTRGSKTDVMTFIALSLSFDSNGIVINVLQNEKLDHGSDRKK